MAKHTAAAAVLALSLAFVSCGGSSKPDPVPPPPQVSIGITPNTTSIKPTKSAVLTVTARNTEIIFPADVQGSFTVTNNQVTYTPPSIAGIYEFTVIASADATKKATARVTVDDSRVKGYLIQSLAEVCKDIVNKEIPESEWPIKGQLIKDAFVHGWQYDLYSVNIPFTVSEIRNGVQKIEFRFPYTYGAGANYRSVLLGTLRYGIAANLVSEMAEVVLHETGHCMGLNEQLTELLRCKFAGHDLELSGDFGSSSNFRYNPFFYNMLLEKVGDSQFWNTVWRSSSPNQAFSKMWDDNMTVNRLGNVSLLVRHSTFIKLDHIAAEAFGISNHLNLLEKFIPFSGIVDVKDELSKLPKLFHDAFDSNDVSAQNQLEDFFNIVERFWEAYPIQGLLWIRPIIEEYMSIFIQDTRTPASQSMPDAA
jgi:hypothetical protein